MSERVENLIVGGGHNGLVCAALLAKAGQSVLVVEAADATGGAARTREFANDARVSCCAHLLHAMPAALVSELQLERHGLSFAATNLPTVSLGANGAHIVFEGGGVEGRAVSDDDKAAYVRFSADMQRFARALVPVFDKLAPELAIESLRQKLELASLGWSLRKLGAWHMREFLRIIGLNFYDLLDEYFASPQLKAALAMDAVLGFEWGPRSMGSVLSYLYRLAGILRNGKQGLVVPQGGMGAVSNALEAAATGAGAEIRTGCRVRRILVDNDRASGVELESGEQLFANRIVSNADPKQTFLGLVSADHLDAGFVRQVSNLRSRGRAGKLHLKLDGAPDIAGLDASLHGARLLVAPSPDDIELAFNPCKYGDYPDAPVLEINLPTAHDTALAADGTHVLSAIVQYLPYDDSAGADAHREACLDTILTTLEGYLPGLRGQLRHAELLTPHDLERAFGMTGGHWHHVEFVFETFLFNRPLPMLARHATPLAGLYLCGAGCHPGGGVAGIAGRNAAQSILAERG